MTWLSPWPRHLDLNVLPGMTATVKVRIAELPTTSSSVKGVTRIPARRHCVVGMMANPTCGSSILSAGNLPRDRSKRPDCAKATLRSIRGYAPVNVLPWLDYIRCAKMIWFVPWWTARRGWTDESCGYAIRHKAVMLVLVVLVILGGLLAYHKLGRLEDPEFTIKEAVIYTVLSGSNRLSKWNWKSPNPSKRPFNNSSS